MIFIISWMRAYEETCGESSRQKCNQNLRFYFRFTYTAGNLVRYVLGDSSYDRGAVGSQELLSTVAASWDLGPDDK
jgi:hypothetical protein